MDNKELFKICISGAAGKIAYRLYSLLGIGDLFGANVPIDLRLLDVPEKKKQLECLVWELEDCGFPLLQKVRICNGPEQAFDDLDFAILLGGYARKPGMERTDLFQMNQIIFQQQGKALNQKAKKTCKVLVVANPANNNCLTLSKHTPNIPIKNITCLMRLDYNRTRMHTALKAERKLKQVKNVIVWGNHSSTVFPDVSYCQIGENKAFKILPTEWIQKQLIPSIQGRGGKILLQKGISSCMAAAQAIRDHIKDWKNGSKDILSMGVIVQQSLYNGIIPSNLCVSLPVRCLGNYQFQIIKDLELNDFQKQKIQQTIKQLINQRQILEKNQNE